MTRPCVDCRTHPAVTKFNILRMAVTTDGPLLPNLCEPCAHARLDAALAERATNEAAAAERIAAKIARAICPGCGEQVHDGNPFEHDGRFWHRVPCWFDSEERQQVAARVAKEPWDVQAHIEREQAPHSRSGWHTKKAKSTTVNGYTI